MAEPVTVTVATTVAATKAIQVVVDDLYKLSKGQVREKVARWRALRKISSLSKKLTAVRKVKTIWETEKEVDLFRFYYPAKVILQSGRKAVRSMKDFGPQKHVLIEGTVGQGKSILLRYLAAQALYDGELIPVFAQLRQLEDPAQLVPFLCSVLEELGFGNDPELFEFLAQEGKIALCLDGFDEVKDAHRSTLIRQVEHLAAKYDSLTIFITSRPDSDIDKSPFFRVYKLAGLTGHDVSGVIEKLTNDKKFTEEVEKAIAKSQKRIQGLLTTPLMVTLLVIAYRADQRIPETLAEFYESLFNTLLLRHDKLKPGFERQRKSGLTDRRLRDAFDAFCFLCRKQQLISVHATEVFPLAKRACELTQVSCDPDSFVADI